MLDQTSRFGFAVKVLGRDGLRSNDTRRHASDPHLRVSLGYIDAILDYLSETGISMYRMSSDIAPYVTHPDLPRFHGQIAESAADLQAVGEKARRLGVRLSMHPGQFIVINSPDPELVRKSAADLLAGAEILDGMGQGPEAVLVIHVGGSYGDNRSGCDRWVQTFATLPEPVRRRLVLENDDLRYSACDVLEIHERTGVPLIFDYQHFCCHNPEGLPLEDTVARFLRTWPSGVAPKIHYSSPNTNFREVDQRDRKTGKVSKATLPPVWTGHADFVNPFEFVTFMRMVEAAGAFDVMLEAKAKDLAVIRLRRDLARYAPDIAARFGASCDPGEDASTAEGEEK
jgi:UV DNA damage endonuclease